MKEIKMVLIKAKIKATKVVKTFNIGMNLNRAKNGSKNNKIPKNSRIADNPK
jgi:hypothetical protein